MKIPGFTEDKEANAIFWKGVRKNVWKGIKLGLTSGIMIWAISTGLASLGVPYVSGFDVFHLFENTTKGQIASGAFIGAKELLINIGGFIGVNSLWWAATNAVVGGNQELDEHKSKLKEKELHGKVKELSESQGKDDLFRKRTEALLDAVEQESSVSGGSTSKAIQDILSRGASQQGSFADKVIADRAIAEAREAAI